MRVSDTNGEDEAGLALAALAWILSDDARAQRFLALTGIDPDGLRKSLSDPALHEAVRMFLQSHQPDLIACADALSVSPAQLLPQNKDIEF
jgi:Protein of unknown function (DUF3572)